MSNGGELRWFLKKRQKSDQKIYLSIYKLALLLVSALSSCLIYRLSPFKRNNLDKTKRIAPKSSTTLIDLPGIQKEIEMVNKIAICDNKSSTLNTQLSHILNTSLTSQTLSISR